MPKGQLATLVEEAGYDVGHVVHQLDVMLVLRTRPKVKPGAGPQTLGASALAQLATLERSACVSAPYFQANIDYVPCDSFLRVIIGEERSTLEIAAYFQQLLDVEAPELLESRTDAAFEAFAALPLDGTKIGGWDNLWRGSKYGLRLAYFELLHYMFRVHFTLSRVDFSMMLVGGADLISWKGAPTVFGVSMAELAELLRRKGVLDAAEGERLVARSVVILAERLCGASQGGGDGGDDAPSVGGTSSGGEEEGGSGGCGGGDGLSVGGASSGGEEVNGRGDDIAAMEIEGGESSVEGGSSSVSGAGEDEGSNEGGGKESGATDPPIVFLSGDCSSRCDTDGFFHMMSAAWLLWFLGKEVAVLHAPGVGSSTRKAGVAKEFTRMPRGERRLNLELAVSGVFRYLLDIMMMVRGFAADDSLPGEPKARPLLPNALYSCTKCDYTDPWQGRSFSRGWKTLRGRRLRLVQGGARGLITIVAGKDGAPPSARLDCAGWCQWWLTLSSEIIAGGVRWRKPWENSWLLGSAIAHVLRSPIPVPPPIQSVLRFTRNAAVHFLITESIWHSDPTTHPLFGRRAAPEVGAQGQLTGGLLGFVLETMPVLNKAGEAGTAVARVAPALRVQGDIEKLFGLGGPNELLDVLLSSIPPLEKQFMDKESPASGPIALLAGVGRRPRIRHLLAYVKAKHEGCDTAFSYLKLPADLLHDRFDSEADIREILNADRSASLRCDDLRKGIRRVSGLTSLQKSKPLASAGNIFEGDDDMKFSPSPEEAVSVVLEGVLRLKRVEDGGKEEEEEEMGEDSLTFGDLELCVDDPSTELQEAALKILADLLIHLVAQRASGGAVAGKKGGAVAAGKGGAAAAGKGGAAPGGKGGAAPGKGGAAPGKRSSANRTPQKPRGGKRAVVGPSPASRAQQRASRSEEVEVYEEVERLAAERPHVLATAWGGGSLHLLTYEDLASALVGKFAFGGVLDAHATLINEYLLSIPRSSSRAGHVVVASSRATAFLPCASSKHHGDLGDEQLRRLFFRSEGGAHLLETSQIRNLRVADLDVLLLIVCIDDKHFVVDAINFATKTLVLMDSAIDWTRETYPAYSEPMQHLQMLLPYLEHIGRCECWTRGSFPRSSRARQPSYMGWRGSWSAMRGIVPQQGASVACGSLAEHNALRYGAGWGERAEPAYRHLESETLSMGMCRTVRERQIYEVKTGSLMKGFGLLAECVYEWPTTASPPLDVAAAADYA